MTPNVSPATAPASSRTLPRRLAAIGRGLALGLLVLVFLTAGLPKLLGLDTPGGSIADFERWGYPALFRNVVGAVETLGALLLLFPRVRVAGATLRFWGAAALAADMLGAAATHVAHAELALLPLPLTLLAATALLAGTARPDALRRARRGDAAAPEA